MNLKHTPCDCAEWRRLNEACADLLAERDALLTALIEIRDSRFCDYEATGRTSYGTGVTDGHRFCSKIARIAIDAMREAKTDA